MAELKPDLGRFIALRRQASRSSAAYQRAQAAFTLALNAHRAAVVELSGHDTGNVRTHLAPAPRPDPDSWEAADQARRDQLEVKLRFPEPRRSAAERAAAAERQEKHRAEQRQALVDKVDRTRAALELATAERAIASEESKAAVGLAERLEAHLRARRIKVPAEAA